MRLEDLRKKADRKIDEVLRALIREEDIWPLPIRIAKPKTTAPLSEWRETIRLIRSQSKEELGFGYTVEWDTVNSKRHGKNAFPSKLSFGSPEDFLRYVGAESVAETVLSNVRTLCEWESSPRQWCASHLALLKKPPEVIQNAVRILSYLKENPGPEVYARQLPVQVPTKFFEQERPLFEAMVLGFAPECLVQYEGTLEERLGLLTKESLIEFRSLDPHASSLPFRHAMAPAGELSRKAHYFEEFESVLVVENHVSFLTLPDLPKTLAIMGSGFAVHRLANVSWLGDKRLLYWGDIDLSGFSILAKFRESYPHVMSLMMDQGTFDRHKSYQKMHTAKQHIPEPEPFNLSPEESAMVERLRSNAGMRLEQEHIDRQYVQSTLLRSTRAFPTL